MAYANTTTCNATETLSKSPGSRTVIAMRHRHHPETHAQERLVNAC